VTDRDTLLGEPLAERYCLERELGRGGMAIVYLALDLKLHRKVAVKVLRPELAASLGNDRFLREIEIAARLNHPHILPVHDSGEVAGSLYYAMPYVEGESLRQRLEREKQLSLDEVIATVRAVASGLTYAHQHGIVHRDIKPENILLTGSTTGADLHPWIADFGIARALDLAAGERLTEAGLVLGTPAYMSPEQADQQSLPDGRSDIYALGCVLFEMLAGAPPFAGPSMRAIMARHAVDPVPSIRTVRQTVPYAVEAAISRALAKVPADRFATADEFSAAMLMVDTAVLPRRAPRNLRRSRILIGSLASMAAVAVGAMVLHGRSAPSVSPAASYIAVLPFSSQSDTMLSRLGRDLAFTLSAALDGIGGLHTVDRLTIAAATAGKGDVSAEEGVKLAQRLGAGSILRGTLVRAGEKVRLDFGLYGSQGLAPVAEGMTVTAHRDSIGVLTDSAGWSLLRQIWQRGTPPSPSLSAVTTRSLPALRAFLDGERAIGANRWDEAALAFQSAIAADTAFWLASFRYALARRWSGAPVESEVLDRLRHSRATFPERERMLIDAFLIPDNTPRPKIDRYRDLAQRFPDYWPVWLLYADVLYHQGPTVGHDWSEGRDALRRVVRLNPTLIPAWEHLFQLTVARDPGEASMAYARLVELGWPSAEDRTSALLARIEAGVSRTGGTIPTGLKPAIDSLATIMVSSQPPDRARLESAPLGLLMRDFPAAQLELNQQVLRWGTPPPAIGFALRSANAWAWAAQGRWDSALAQLHHLSQVHPGPLAGRRPLMAVESYALAVVGAWLGAAAPSLADERRPVALAAIGQLADNADQPEEWCRVAWLDGILAFARGDRQSLQGARVEVSRSGYYQAQLAARSLGAFIKALDGDRRNAGQELAALEEHCLVNESCNSFLPYYAVQRFAAAQWLRESGDLDTAARLLRWQDAPWISWMWALNNALNGPTLLARAQIDEARGSPASSRLFYQQFLRLYQQPTPSQAHLVDGAKAALARLQGEQ